MSRLAKDLHLTGYRNDGPKKFRSKDINPDDTGDIRSKRGGRLIVHHRDAAIPRSSFPEGKSPRIKELVKACVELAGHKSKSWYPISWSSSFRK
jgi:hypothetical protein